MRRPSSRRWARCPCCGSISVAQARSCGTLGERWDLAMDQYLLIPFLGGWTSIYQLFWCSPGVQGFDTLPSDEKDVLTWFYTGWWWLEPWNFEWLSRNSWEWNNHPNWRTPSFFRGVETTNQHMIWPDFTWFEIFKRQHIGILRGTLVERWVGHIMGIVHGENWPYCILMELTSVMSPSDFAKLPGPLIIIGVPCIAKCHTMSYCHYFRGTPVINQPGSIDSRYSPVIFHSLLWDDPFRSMRGWPPE